MTVSSKCSPFISFAMSMCVMSASAEEPKKAEPIAIEIAKYDTKKAVFVSAAALLANPPRFAGREAVVTGWIWWSGKECFLFPSSELFEVGDHSSKIGITFEDAQPEKRWKSLSLLDPKKAYYGQVVGIVAGGSAYAPGWIGPHVSIEPLKEVYIRAVR